MKILFVGQLWKGGTAGMRCAILRDLGHDVAALDTTVRDDATSLSRLARKVAYKLGYPMGISGVNVKLNELASSHDPDIVWVDKGVSIRAETLKEIKAKNGNTILLHYNPDDPFGAYGKAGWRVFLEALPEYDVHFVPRRVNVDEYYAVGAKKVHMLLPARGFDPSLHRPLALTEEEKLSLGADVGFVGSYERDRAEMILRLAVEGIFVRIWGEPGPWPHHKNIRHEGRALYGEDYVRAINSFKVVLAFLRKANRDQHTSRSIEIPACGAFMLAERTPEHVSLFEEGKECEFFASASELVRKVKFYLTNHAVREAVASRGRQRCLKGGYDYASRLKEMIVLATK